jgi:hypothetical protein
MKEDNPIPTPNIFTDSTYNAGLSHKIQVMKDLFKGRTDAFGLCVMGNSFVAKNPIRDSDYKMHITGDKNHRIGILPLIDGGVHWAAVDVDQENREAVERICFHLRESGIFPHIERSKSKGYHIWIFFDGLIAANVIRCILKKILSDAGYKDQFEIFPKQDGGEFGNYVFLPEHGESVRNERTVFLNPDFTPIPDQWKYLENVSLTKVEDMAELYRSVGEEPQDREPPPSPGPMFDVPKYLLERGVRFTIKQDLTKTLYLLPECFWADQHTTADGHGDSAVIQDVTGLITYHCFHQHCQERTWRDVRELLSLKTEQKKPGAKSGRNLSEDLKLYIECAYGTFTTSQVYSDLDVRTTTDKNLIRMNLHRLAKRGELERGLSNGTFRKIDKETNHIIIEETISKPLPIKWPGGLEEYVKIMRKTTVGVAGTMQAGKTAYLLNVAWQNKDLLPTHYFTSEFGGDELRERLEPFGYPMEKWRAITFIERSRDFQDVINPDGLNLIDYLEVSDEGEYFKMGIQIKRIYERLNQGVAVIGLQKKFGSDFGYGGQPTADKPRLYVTLEKSTLKIVKAKLWTGEVNPNGMSRRFKLHKGARFSWDSWQYP